VLVALLNLELVVMVQQAMVMVLSVAVEMV
jgi:hypothetical protein